LYGLLAERYGVEPVRAVERVEPVVAGRDETEALGCRPGAPLLLVERTAFDSEAVAVEFARDVFRGDRTRMVLESTLPAAVRRT
jgi:GntR family transcriptional regulator